MKTLRRIPTFIFLLIALATLTGIAQATATFAAVEASIPCCPEETPVDKSPFDLPCCATDCHCTACQGIELSQQFLFLNTTLEALCQYHFLLTSFPPGHNQVIEYPPETA